MSFNNPNWELTTHEKEVLYPLVINMLSHRDKSKVFPNSKIRKTLEEFGEDINDAQIRKIVFHIRMTGDIPLLIANSEGYYRATNIQEVNKWIKTHIGKIEAMNCTLTNIESQFYDMKLNLNSEDSTLVGQISIFDVINDKI